MKLSKTASGKTSIKMSKKEWTDMGKKAGWINDKVVDDPKTVLRSDKPTSKTK